MDLNNFGSCLAEAAIVGSSFDKPGCCPVKRKRSFLAFVYADDSLSEVFEPQREVKGYIFQRRNGHYVFVYRAYAPEKMPYLQACAFCATIKFRGVSCIPGSADFLMRELYDEQRNVQLCRSRIEPVDERLIWSSTPCSYYHWMVDPLNHQPVYGRDLEAFYVRPVLDLKNLPV